MLCAKVCRKTHSIINRHLLPFFTACGDGSCRTEGHYFGYHYRYFCFPFCFSRQSGMFRYTPPFLNSAKTVTRRITGIPPHPLTAIPAFSMERLTSVQNSKGCFISDCPLNTPDVFSQDSALCEIIIIIIFQFDIIDQTVIC